MAVSANRLELLQIADAVAREKSIDRMIVVTAMEDAIQKAARSRYGQETDVRAEINSKTGEIKLQRLLKVVDEVENTATDILVADARRRNPAAQVGDFIAEPLPPMDFGRIAAQSAKQVIVQKVREAERDRQYDEFKDRIGEIVNGQVKRVEYGNVIVDLGRGEGIVRRDEMIPRETFRYGDRIRAYIYDVRREQRGPQIFLSRTHPQFMTRLFAQEVPEIYDGIIEVKSVARDPGSRAKIAVISRDSSIDPVGACVGMRGSRVQAVVNELQGEKIDIIPWSGDAATFIVNALQPAEVAKVVLDEEAERIEVVVPDDQLSLAIGRRGQNVRLASQLTGWDIDILTEQEESERRQKEFQERSVLFVEALDVDEVVGQLLASEGFANVEEIAYIELEDLASIEGFDDDTATELQTRAREYLARIEGEQDEERKALGVADELKEIPGITTAALVALGKADIRTVEDFAGLVPDDLVGYVERKDGESSRTPGALDGFDTSRAEAEAMIMQARLQAGWITQEDLDRATAAEEAEEADVADEDAAGEPAAPAA
jgi:N utilization substance protein A